MSAPSIASRAAACALTGRPSSAASAAATSRARAWSRPVMRIPVSGRVAASARACACAWTPVPTIASSAAPGLASRPVATAEVAAVRISVTADAFTSASGSPVSAANSRTAPWCASLPMAGLPGVTQIALRP